LITLLFLHFLNYFINAKTFSEAFRSSLGIGLGIFFLFSFFLIFYIKILAGKKAEQIEKEMKNMSKEDIGKMIDKFKKYGGKKDE